MIKDILIITLMATGIALITHYSNWQTAVGVFLLIGGNNAELLGKVVRK